MQIQLVHSEREPGTDAGRRLAGSADFFAFLERETPKLIDRWLELRRG